MRLELFTVKVTLDGSDKLDVHIDTDCHGLMDMFGEAELVKWCEPMAAQVKTAIEARRKEIHRAREAKK